MHPFRSLSLLAVAAFAFCLANAAHSADQTAPISAEDFVEEASAKGIAEIETAKLALEKASNQDIKNFAQTMIDDHSKANLTLGKLASQKELEVSDDAELINQAKALILKLRDEDSFDKAYMNNQVMAHKQTIDLFNRASKSEDEQIAAFAKETLPKLQHHLQMAEQINAQIPDD
ncbi:DUF4142 domain-containing protein [Pseudomonas sp. EA_35y_Pfl2_R111]|uniref:DUF4142 domain-containing protein n=1 Tax=Pseudomonas sp. EA_35y_Pfl2_R111 TaxID=3088689 RepID=UPI0030DA0D4F